MDVFHTPVDDMAGTPQCKHCGVRLDKKAIERSLHNAMYYQDDPGGCDCIPCNGPPEFRQESTNEHDVCVRLAKGPEPTEDNDAFLYRIMKDAQRITGVNDG